MILDFVTLMLMEIGCSVTSIPLIMVKKRNLSVYGRVDTYM